MKKSNTPSALFRNIESLIYSIDKSSFAEKEKILFYKQIVYMLK